MTSMKLENSMRVIASFLTGSADFPTNGCLEATNGIFCIYWNDAVRSIARCRGAEVGSHGNAGPP